MLKSVVREADYEPDNELASFGVLTVNKCTVKVHEDMASMVEKASALAVIYAQYLLYQDSKDVLKKVDVKMFQEFFDQCEKEFLRGNAEEIARIDAIDFELSEEALTRDGLDLKRVGTIEQLVKLRQEAVSHNRYNEERFHDLFTNVSDAKVLHMLATEGASVPVAADFVSQPDPEKPRGLQRRLGKCYMKHAFKLWQKNCVLILKREDVEASELEKLNDNPLNWTVKPLVPPGRMLGDLSNRKSGTPINCPESKALAAELYGDMSYPMIDEIIFSWLDYASKRGYKLHEMRMWKDDIRSAFGQFNFKPSETYKLAFTFAEGLIMIMICGFFGWTGAPQVFANFSRGMLEIVRAAIVGVVFIFCDDFIGFGHRDEVDRDQLIAQQVIVRTFGDDAWADEKCVTPCVRTEILGWWVDLISETVRPSDKGIRKLTFSFFMVKTNDKYWELEFCQLLASLAQRYSAALMGMKPFVQPFHSMCEGPQTIKWRKVSAKAKFALEMWRVAIILLFMNKESMSVSMEVMAGWGVGYNLLRFITDASYLGVGFLLLLENLELQATAPFVSYHFPFKLKNGKHQNHREFLGFIVGLLTLIKLKMIPTGGATLHIVNDNVAALEWARKNMCAGKASQVAFMVYSVILIKYKLRVVQVEHTPGDSELMDPVDKLSRHQIPKSFDREYLIDLNASPAVKSLMLMCDPTVVKNVEEYHSMFTTVHALLQQFDNENA